MPIDRLAEAINSHRLYKDGDEDAPDEIKDRNGSIVLQMCRDCGAYEADLEDYCPKNLIPPMPEGFEQVKWQEVKAGDGVWVRGRCQGQPFAYGPFKVEKPYVLFNPTSGMNFTEYQECLVKPEGYHHGS